MRFWECISQFSSQAGTFRAANNLAVFSLGYKICSAIGKAKGGSPCKTFHGDFIDANSCKKLNRMKN